MRLTVLIALAAVALAHAAAKSPKRGLVSTPNDNWPDDDAIWVSEHSPISWYYNFHWNATPTYASLPQERVEFVPMLWGGGANDTYFLGNITALINGDSKTPGRNITHVLVFNQPDQSFSDGGSQMTPLEAAQSWMRNLAPLREQFGVKLSLPSAGDPRGGWMESFLKNCSNLNEGKDCVFDFVPVHSFGDFGVLKDRVGKFSSA